MNTDNNNIPTLSEYESRFRRPNWLDDPRTPVEETLKWLRGIEEKYYKLYGQEKIELLRRGKEGI